MIIKSLSRKSPTFGQLAAYMSSEKSDERFDLYRNCFSRSHADIATEFFENSSGLAKRKNGNYLYHEIISISVEDGTATPRHKECLQEIVDSYVDARCPNNMVYGCLHEDHSNNLHYHLMISANERGERGRTRLSRAHFDTIKRKLEEHVLAHYPELKQKELIGANKQGEKMSRKAGEVQRRLGELPKRDEVKLTIAEAMNQTSSMNNFHFFLEERGYRFYVRGKNYGVEVAHEDGSSKKYRFSTLGLHDDFEAFSALVSQHREESAEAPRQSQGAEASQDSMKPSQSKTAEASKQKEPEKNSKKERASDTLSSNKQKAKRQKSKKHVDIGQEEDMKLRDVLGVKETYKEKKKAKSASKDDVRKAAEDIGKRTEQRVKQDMDKTAKETAKKTAQQVQEEFERMTAQRKESAKHMPKNKQ
jgi:hypothetical protein